MDVDLCYQFYVLLYLLLTKVLVQTQHYRTLIVTHDPYYCAHLKH
jgi:hypothetical protein